MPRRPDAASPAADPDDSGRKESGSEGKESGSEELWSQVSLADQRLAQEAWSQASQPEWSTDSSRPSQAPSPRAAQPSRPGLGPAHPPRQAAPVEGPPAGLSRGRCGLLNHFPTLELKYSDDAPLNVGRALMARMVTFKWKQLVWLLRARVAVQRPGGPLGAGGWRRPHRWVATLLARELASIWGHLGHAAQSMRGPRGPLAMR